jgi:Zn-dependent protease with chaperone function
VTSPSEATADALDTISSARAEFIERVRREEKLANQNPKAYRRKVYGLVAIAYSYIFGVLLFSILLVISLVRMIIEAGSGHGFLIKFVIIFGLIVLAVVRSLFVKIDPPKGYRLRKKDAPELYREVNAIADRLKAPRPSEIIIDHRINAAAAQTPRLGVFGWYRNTLLLGLPLLLGLSKDEARAVIAHEFGHFSGAHGKFGAWAYRVDQTWRQLGEHFSSGHVNGAWLFVGFVGWFQPRFAATTFALQRANEYEADAAAAEVAGPTNMARGLMRLVYLDKHLQDTFWEEVTQISKRSPAPPPQLFDTMPKAVRTFPEPALIERRLANALKSKTDFDDTHPSLTDRLTALKQVPPSIGEAIADLSKPVAHNAAEAFFGSRFEQVLRGVEEVFVSEAKDQWRKQFKKFQDARQELTALRAKASEGPLAEERQLDLAYLVYIVEGSTAAEPIFRNLHETFPNNPRAMLWLGKILAEREDPKAEGLLRRAMQLNPEMTEHALTAIAELHFERGDQDKLAALRDEAVHTVYTREIVQEAAKSLDLADRFEPNGLTDDDRAAIRVALSGVPKLDVAYLVSKVAPNGERLMTLIAFHNRKGLEINGEPQQLVHSLAQVQGLPYPTYIFSPKDVKKWKERLDPIPGAKIFELPK